MEMMNGGMPSELAICRWVVDLSGSKTPDVRVPDLEASSTAL
jgi:hypothetical protein